MCMVTVLFLIDCGGKTTGKGAAHDTETTPPPRTTLNTAPNSVSTESELTGTWHSRNELKMPEYNVNAVEEKTFVFYNDGGVTFVERKKGQTGKYMKEDWEFVSKGTYGLAEDTIQLFITRLSAVQNFQRLNIKNDQWEDSSIPPFKDSLITDGSQDRFITLEDLKRDFKKII